MKNNKMKLDWLIAARGYAMFGVFLGHLMVPYFYTHGFVSLEWFGQFLEPVFVPFFAILSGAFYQRPKGSFTGVFKLRFSQRILPVLFYLLLVLPFYFIIPQASGAQVFSKLIFYPLGVPILNWPCWFLVALFSAELIYFFLPGYKNKPQKALLMSACLYALIWLFNQQVMAWPQWVGIVSMLWMLQAAVLFCGFFYLGQVLKKWILSFSRKSSLEVALYGVAGLAVMIPAVLYNDFQIPPDGHFRSKFSQEMVVISIGQYGYFWHFLFSTLGGALALLSLARLLPVTRFMRECGDYSLLLLGLNGIFYAVLNNQIVQYLVPARDVLWLTMAYSLSISFASMAICLPIAKILARQLPQLTGKPMISGPILPALYKKADRKTD